MYAGKGHCVCVRVEEDIIRHQKMVVKEENPNP